MLCLFAVFAFSCNEEMERLLTDDYPSRVLNILRDTY